MLRPPARKRSITTFEWPPAPRTITSSDLAPSVLFDPLRAAAKITTSSLVRCPQYAVAARPRRGDGMLESSTISCTLDLRDRIRNLVLLLPSRLIFCRLCHRLQAVATTRAGRRQAGQDTTR